METGTCVRTPPAGWFVATDVQPGIAVGTDD